uniref:TauD/TfdA-like domain-containing protein n=1 Tax=Odontella aurita TaxID=265563 RepID=A0A7S4MPH4_9STRA
MKAICSQIFQVLKPGGKLVCGAPHPMMFAASSNIDLRLGDYCKTNEPEGGLRVDPSAYFKTISDYIETLKGCGFKIVDMKEARSPSFRSHTHRSDFPNHLVFDVEKPKNSATNAGLNSIPCKIAWSSFERSNPERALRLDLPENAAAELHCLATELVRRGVTSDTYCPTDEDVAHLENVVAFAGKLRRHLSQDVGAAHVRRLPMEPEDDLKVSAAIAKLSYYILCSLVGRVDGGARGRLFDVRDARLDAKKQDNVLFSVSQGEAPWHSDGASVDRSYDAVGLFCIHPAEEGGISFVSNAASAFEKLKSRLPGFLMHELLRPIPRDVMENGKGIGVEGGLKKLSRTQDVLVLRSRYNSYPIFVEEAGGGGERRGRLRFRYMRHWIETGHRKAGLTISPLLRIAMDALDAALDEETVFDGRLERGEMFFCNNNLFAHGRSAFVDSGPGPRRHMVRAWIQLQELS